MKIIIISYSYTGNNDALAESIAKELSAKHFKVSKSMTMRTIITDMIFSRTPKVQPAPDILGEYDLVFLFGPVWMGQMERILNWLMNF